MFHLNKKWFVGIHPFGTGIAVVIAVLAVSLVLFAQNHPKKNNSGNHTYDSSWWNSNVPEKYWLNDDQISQVNKIRTEYDDLIQPKIEKLNSVRNDFYNYQQQDEISSKRIREYQTELRDIEDNIYSLKMEAGSKMRNILSKAQRPYYDNYVFNDWCDDRGWNYSGNMDYGMGKDGYMDYGMKNRSCMHNNRCCW